MTQTRITQLGVESVASPTPASRITQLGVESVVRPTPVTRVTQLGLEVVVANRPLSRFSQLGLEVVLPYAAPLVSGGSVQYWPRGGSALPGGTNTPGGAAGGDLGGTYANPTTGGIKSVPMVGTLGTGQVWVKDSSAQLIPYTPGSPSTAYTVFDPFVPDVSPHALNEEFTSSSLASFGTVYTGDAGVVVDANTTVPGWLFMEAPNVNYKIRALTKALPGDTNWTLHTCVSQLTGSHSDGFWGLLGLTNNATAGSGNQHYICAPQSTSDGKVTKTRIFWDGWGLTASGANGASFGGGNSGQRGIAFLRWRKQSGTYYMGWSADGLLWWETSTTLYASMTPTHFALGLQQYSGNTVGRCAFGYLRYYANGTQLTTGGSRIVYA